MVGIAAGEDHGLALLSGGTVYAWGGNASGQSTVPSGLTGVSAVAAGWNYSLALIGGPLTFALVHPVWDSGGFRVSLSSQAGTSYTLQYKSALGDAGWTSLSPAAGNGGVLALTDASATGSQRFYRVLAQ